MIRSRVAMFVAVLLVGLGAFSGRAFAIPWFSVVGGQGSQHFFPAALPGSNQFTFPVYVSDLDYIDDMSIGRDDASPFATVTVRFVNNFGGAFTAGVPMTFTYRPLLDPITMPLGMNNAYIPNWPLSMRGDLMEHFTCCDVFARHAVMMRSHASSVRGLSGLTPGGSAVMQLWLDPTVLTPPPYPPSSTNNGQNTNTAATQNSLHHLEFYKFQLLL